MSAIKINEEQMVKLVRNALLVAGNEMGEEGDHWPVVNSTIHSIMKDWEELKIERNVHAEMRTHLYEQLDRMDEIIVSCPDEVKADAEPKLRKLREIYDAYFSMVAPKDICINEDDMPVHVKRAEAIIMTLENDDE